MGVANVAQTLASQQEWVRPELEDLSLTASTLWRRIEKNTKVQAVSNRPFRVPTLPIQGAKFRVGDFDGGDLGIGSGPSEVVGTGSCVSFVQASSYTALSEWATDTDEKAIENFADLTHRMAAKTFGGYMDALIQGDSSNTLDTVVTAGSDYATVNNANLFQNGQDVDIWSAVGGSLIASYTILTADAVTATLTFTTAISGVTTGNVIMVSGSSGQPNSGMNGLRTFAVSTNTGIWMNVQRSSYPGMYTTPSIPVGGALTPSVVRELQALVELAKGLETDDDSVVAHMSPNERNQWEANALLVQRIDYTGAGDSSADMLKKKASGTIAGREALVNVRAVPGYIDFLNLKNWFRVETKPLDFYSVGGQTLFPIRGASGGLASSYVFYLCWMGQLVAVQTRENAFLSGIAIQKGLFGH